MLTTARLLEGNDLAVPELLQHRIAAQWAAQATYIGAPLLCGTAASDALKLVQACLKSSEDIDAQLRREKWRSSLTTVAGAASARSYAFVKSHERQPFTVMKNNAGELTADPEKQATLVMDYWQRLRTAPCDGREQFDMCTMQVVPRGQAWCPTQITVHALLGALSSMRKGAAPGVDGWRAEEVAALPQKALQELLQVMTLMEDTLEIPTLWNCALATLVPKTRDQPCVHQFRPISVFAVAWRAYAKVRFAQLMQHINPLLHKWQFGGRPQLSAVDPIIELGHHLDAALTRLRPSRHHTCLESRLTSRRCSIASRSRWSLKCSEDGEWTKHTWLCGQSTSNIAKSDVELQEGSLLLHGQLERAYHKAARYL